MKKKFILIILFLSGCNTVSNNLETNHTLKSSSLPKRNGPVIEAINSNKKPYTLDLENVDKLISNIISESTISDIYTDNNDNFMFSRMDGSFYKLSGFNKLTVENIAARFRIVPQYNRFYLNQKGNGLFLFIDSKQSDLLILQPPKMIKFNRFVPEKSFSSISYSINPYYIFFDSNNELFFYDISETELKIYKTENLKENILEKSITFPDNYKSSNSFISNKDGNGFIIRKLNNTNQYNIYKLENKKLTLIKQDLFSLDSNFSGNIDLEGNGYIYYSSLLEKQTKIFQVEKYNINFDNSKIINGIVDSKLYINSDGKGFLIKYTDKEISYSELDNFKLNSETTLLGNINELNSFKVAINKYGVGFISWYSEQDNKMISSIKIIKDYTLQK